MAMAVLNSGAATSSTSLHSPFRGKPGYSTKKRAVTALPALPTSIRCKMDTSAKSRVIPFEHRWMLEATEKLGPVNIRTTYMHSLAKALEEACDHVLRQPGVNARVSASLDSNEGITDGARKALEQMFQGKNNLAKKWEEEIKKRELGRDGSGGGGGGGDGSSGGGGRGWGGAGGGGSDDMDEDFGGQDESWDWEEAGQTFMATFALIILYFSITHGPKQVFRLFRLFFRWVRQGFTLRKIPDEYLIGSDTEDEEDEQHNSDEDSDDEMLLRRDRDASASNAQKRNNRLLHEEVEEESDGEDLPPPPQHKKEDRRAIIQAQQKEKILQMLTPKDRRGKEDK